MNLYRSPFSQITLQRDRDLLIFSWLDNSKTLAAEGVKEEIIQILNYIDPHEIRNIIIDSSMYHFRENEEIQAWINFNFMARVMETPVEKYGFVVGRLIKKYETLNKDNNDEKLKVAYFHNLTDACSWIDS